MSEENVEIVRRWIEAFNSGGIEEAIALLDPDVEWTTTTAYLEAGTYRGHEGVRQFIQRGSAAWEDLRLEPERLIDAGDQVVIPVRLEARDRQTGTPATLTYTVVASLQFGKIVSIRNYAKRADAFAAARVSE